MKKILQDEHVALITMTMKTKKQNNLPKTAAEITNGGLYHQSVRCGKSNCRCASGDLHKGYYYFIRQIGGKQRKTYVPKDQVAKISAAVSQSRNLRQLERRTSGKTKDLIIHFNRRLREHASIIRDIAGEIDDKD